MRKQILLIFLIVIAAAIDITGIIHIIKLNKENAKLKEYGYYLPSMYHNSNTSGFGKIYEIQKAIVDNIPLNTFYISKDNKMIRYNSTYSDGSIIEYEVYLSEMPLSDSVLNAIIPDLIDAFKKTELKINEHK